MDTIKILSIVAAVLAIGTVIAYLKLKKKVEQESSYRRRRPLGTIEQAMYWRLVKLFPDHVVLAKVALSQCVGIKGAAFDLLSRESLDFVICNKAMRIIAAIELEDRIDPSQNRRSADRIKEEALEIAGIRLLKWPASPLPSEAFVAMEFNNSSNNSTGMARLAA